MSESGLKDPYEVLGVSPGASDEEIRAAYGRLVRFHERGEDDSPWARAHLQQVEEAYAVLSDPQRRAHLDAGNGPATTASTAAAPLVPPLPVPPAERRRSRNPVDRLTRRLPRPWRVAIDWIVTIAGAIAIVLAIKAWVVNPYRIPTSSMEPTLHCAGTSGCQAHYSDRVLANRFIFRLRSPHRKEIVVFKTPRAARVECGAGGTFVKRLIGEPGDTVSYENNVLRVNGKLIKEGYVKANRAGGLQGNWSVKKGQYFFMGDNRSASCDSRTWGGVPRKNLIGPVFMTYWPPTRVAIYSLWLALPFGLVILRPPRRRPRVR